MEGENLICKNCMKSEIKVGKISGIAALQSLDSKTGIGGSELKVYFCSKCGEVIKMIVNNPDAIKNKYDM